MRLTRIRLAGFKSFVDPTTFALPGQLVGIVGPNGCGKSNVIDAVRWVLGESSARSLRGESMADVIFNGSSARKPVGQATIELSFDNSTGRLGGPWARYNEIAVKRVVSRSGQSSYFLNGTRCRRRDVTGLFLGTGLGPRSYAIIEQGMIARVIESKPEELRVFLEEAAGISRYKERRRETENRIRHTRDNLEQLNTLRDELERQLETLRRQARNAERYREYRAEERRLKAELLALRWRDLDSERQARERDIHDEELAQAQLLAAQRQLESHLETLRQQRGQATEGVDQHQEAFYRLGAEITRLEQAHSHRQALRSRYLAEKTRLEERLDQLACQLDTERDGLAALEREIQTLGPEHERLQQRASATSARRDQLAADYQCAQRDWEDAARTHAEHQREAEVSRTRIEYLEHRQLEQQRRLEQTRLALDTLRQQADDGLAELDEDLASAILDLENQRRDLHAVEHQLTDTVATEHHIDTAIDTDRQRQQSIRGRLSSLETLQHAALEGDHERERWLSEHKLDGLPRLAETIAVDSPWETALETVLEGHLDTRWVEDGLEAVLNRLDNQAPGGLAFMSPTNTDTAPADSLQTRVTHPALPDHLHPVRTVADLATALRQRHDLAPGESLVTPEGVWLGRHWLKSRRPDHDPRAGMLTREREIRTQQAELTALETGLTAQQQQLQNLRETRSGLEARRRQLGAELQASHAREARLQAEVAAARRRQTEREARQQILFAEIQELALALTDSQEAVIDTRQELEESLLALEDASVVQAQADARRRACQDVLDEARREAEQLGTEAQRGALTLESLLSRRAATASALARLGDNHADLQVQLADLAPPPTDTDEDALQLDGLLAARLQAETELTSARQHLGELEAEITRLETDRGNREQITQQSRSRLEERRLAWGEVRVKAQGLLDQLTELQANPDLILARLPDDANEAAWQEDLARVGERIQRLGAVNLAAIDEFQQQSERKSYLDSQHQDLSEALATLESAIRQIDRETRERLQDTFERVNRDLQTLFPRLFGGGEAHLILTGEDLLDAGVAVMARPPGKRIGTIHLLSGGEKTLSAIALVFAIFQLNPAPFCMLDEVDAPLDEANVGRFGELLREMASTIQFIVITHNKATMGMMDHLTGVTMGEPGVSRVVAVDVDEALRLAAV